MGFHWLEGYLWKVSFFCLQSLTRNCSDSEEADKNGSHRDVIDFLRQKTQIVACPAMLRFGWIGLLWIASTKSEYCQIGQEVCEKLQLSWISQVPMRQFMGKWSVARQPLAQPCAVEVWEAPYTGPGGAKIDVEAPSVKVSPKNSCPSSAVQWVLGHDLCCKVTVTDF